MFERSKGRKKEILKIVKDILNSVNEIIDNYEIMSILYEHFSRLFNNKKYYVAFFNNNEICIKKNKSDDIFHLLITPSLDKFNTIAFHIVDKDGIYEQEVTIQFKDNGNQIIVTEHTIEKNIQGKNQEVLAISNKTRIRNYIEKDLRYDYNYDTETCFRMEQNYSCATLSEVFVDLDKNAVKRVGHISEDGYYDDPAEIIYYESNDYYQKPFDTKFRPGSENTKMQLSNEEKFNEFINANNNVINLRKQK